MPGQQDLTGGTPDAPWARALLRAPVVTPCGRRVGRVGGVVLDVRRGVVRAFLVTNAACDLECPARVVPFDAPYDVSPSMIVVNADDVVDARVLPAVASLIARSVVTPCSRNPVGQGWRLSDAHFSLESGAVSTYVLALGAHVVRADARQVRAPDTLRAHAPASRAARAEGAVTGRGTR